MLCSRADPLPNHHNFRSALAKQDKTSTAYDIQVSKRFSSSQNRCPLAYRGLIHLRGTSLLVSLVPARANHPSCLVLFPKAHQPNLTLTLQALPLFHHVTFNRKHYETFLQRKFNSSQFTEQRKLALDSTTAQLERPDLRPGTILSTFSRSVST